MVSEPVLSLTVVSSLDVALLLVGAVGLSWPRAEAEPVLMACSCGRPHCSGVRRAEAVT